MRFSIHDEIFTQVPIVIIIRYRALKIIVMGGWVKIPLSLMLEVITIIFIKEYRDIKTQMTKHYPFGFVNNLYY